LRKPEIIALGDDWFEIIKTLKDDPKYDAAILREYWNCDRTFRKDGILFFCREIPKVDCYAVD
jgi:hypothetical protein